VNRRVLTTRRADPQIPQLGAFGTSLGMTWHWSASSASIPFVVGAGFTPARAKSIPCFSASKHRTLYGWMVWSVSRPRSVTPDSGGGKPLPYNARNLQRKAKSTSRGATKDQCPGHILPGAAERRKMISLGREPQDQGGKDPEPRRC